MTSTVAAERAFVTFRRGELREDALRLWRNHLRQQTNPDTGAAFTEDEIAAATVRQSRWYIDADKDDLVFGMAAQQRALFLADQLRPDRASSGFLNNQHGPLWLPEGKLPASGGSGTYSAPATVGSPFVGSTTVPDAAATQLRDAAGRRFQVLFSVFATAGGAGGGVDGAVLTLKGVDTGEETNIAAGTELEYSANGPLGAAVPGAVVADFRGGAAAETDADFAKRMLDRIRYKPASGNAAHFRHWARGANVAVQDGYVYSCAFHANSLLVAVTAKRGTTLGPTGRIPSVGTLADVIARIVPPGSPVVPAMPHVLVVDTVPQSSDMVMALDMRRLSSAGWTDGTSWPGRDGVSPTTVTDVTSQVSFKITYPSSVPLPSSTPSLMAWNAAQWRFEKLAVQSVTADGANVFSVTLSSAPAMTIATGVYVMPDNGKRLQIAQAIEAYFDSLGPGEIVATTDDRAHRALRFPEPYDEAPQVAGSGVVAYLRDTLQASLANEQVVSVSSTTPAIPADPLTGPSLMVAGKVAVYPE